MVIKIQDLIFLGTLGILFFLRKPSHFIWAGLVSLLLAIPLFATWTFFTAERLTWYAASFFLAFVLISLLRLRGVQ